MSLKNAMKGTGTVFNFMGLARSSVRSIDQSSITTLQPSAFTVISSAMLQQGVLQLSPEKKLTKTDKFYIKINISFYLGSINVNFKIFFEKIEKFKN